MEVLQFDILSKFAHFRKYYSTNTALTFSIPPRTTIMGILAAILGIEKDKYYNLLSSENLKIGVFSASPIKKTFHRLNLLKIEGQSDITGSKAHAQTPFEIIVPYNIKTEFVKYRIYLLAVSDRGKEIVDKLLEKFDNKTITYAITLGLANFSAFIGNYSIIEAKEVNAKEKELAFHSAVDSAKVKRLIFKQQDDFDFVEEDMFPAEFNSDRSVKRFDKLLFSLGGKPIRVIYSGEFLLLNSGINIQVF